MKKGKLTGYSTSMKIAIAKEWLMGELGYSKLALKYGIDSRYTVRHIVTWYKQNYPEFENYVPVVITESEKAENLELRAQLQLLDQKLAEANLQIEALNAVISIAETNFDIDIRKKSGSKQQTK